MSAFGRLLLYVMTGVEVLVLANERLFTRVNFQRDEGLKTASGHSGLLRLRNHPAGKDKFLGFSIPATTGNIALMLPRPGKTSFRSQSWQVSKSTIDSLIFGLSVPSQTGARSSDAQTLGKHLYTAGPLGNRGVIVITLL